MGGEKEPELPPISTTIAVLLLIAYTVIYVAPFYLSSTTRPSPTLSRDAPSVIRGRIRSVTTTCIICSLFTFVLLSSLENGSPFKSIHLMGWFPIGILEALKSVGLTAILFLGPLFESGIAEGGWRNWIRLRGLNTVISGWIGWRNFVAGPITEEDLFRSASVTLLHLAFWRICYVLISEDWKSIVRYSCACLLQLDGLAARLGEGYCGGARFDGEGLWGRKTERGRARSR